MIGQIVISEAGHDKGTLYLVVARKEGMVFLADGYLKRYDKPKKKKEKHVRFLNETVDAKLLEKLLSGERVEDTAIKYALKQYKKATTI